MVTISYSKLQNQKRQQKVAIANQTCLQYRKGLVLRDGLLLAYQVQPKAMTRCKFAI